MAQPTHPVPVARLAVTVQAEDFDPNAELDQLTAQAPDIGAVVMFVGLVRDTGIGPGVTALELEHYPGMTEKSLHAIASEAAVRWPVQAVRIIHRVGKLQASDRIVLVLTASRHRQHAYDSNAFIMDFLKTEAPFWKKEWTPQGPRWVEARASDASAASRWHQLMSDHYGYPDHD